MRKHIKRGANWQELNFLSTHEEELKKKKYWNVYNTNVLAEPAKTTTNHGTNKFDMKFNEKGPIRRVKRKNLAKILKGEERLFGSEPREHDSSID
jgi:transcriptional accessory protein Tex/SPT6